jgi:hypothetical protein
MGQANRYQIFNKAEHSCCWDALIVDTKESPHRRICECREEDAKMICEALNRGSQCPTCRGPLHEGMDCQQAYDQKIKTTMEHIDATPHGKERLRLMAAGMGWLEASKQALATFPNTPASWENKS